MNEIINSSTLRQGSAPWNTEIVSFNQNVKLDLWGQSANDVLKIRRVRVQEGAIIHTNNQTCCITPATKAQVKASKVVLRCDCDGSYPAELTTDVTSIILSAGAYVFEYAGSGFAAKTTVLTYEESKKEACDCACAQAPCLPVSITTVATGETSANVTIVSGSDTYGREVTVKLFNGANEYEQVGVNGDVLTFAGLQPSTTYSVVATNDCSEKDTSQVTTATPPPCPALVLTAAATGTNSVAVTVVSGGSAWIELNGEKRYVDNGDVATFNDLTPAKEYFAIGTSDCGSIANVSATTQACPAISLTQTSNTTGSITVTLVSGGTASVFVGSDEAILANGASYTFTDLTAGKNYTAKVISECGNKANFTIATAPCPAVDFTVLALTTTSLQVTAVAGMPLTISVVSQGGAVLDSVDGVSSTVVFTDLPEGAIVTVKAVNECGKKKQLNVNLPDPAPVAEPFCASLNLKDESPKFAGFAYFPEDNIDPAATVPFRGGFIYPTRGKGHTVKITDALGAVIGYAANKSDCANPCCEPIVELKKCDGSVATSDDLFITKGDLLDCEGNPLPCDAKLKQCCDTEVIVTRPTGLFNSTGCITGEASGTDSDGRIVWRSRDNTCVVGGGITGADNQYVQFDIENPFDCDALIEIDMQALCESFNSQLDSNQSVTYLHCISESLNVEPYPYGSTGWANDTNGWAWTTTDFNAQSGSAAGGNQPPIFPNSINGASPQTTSTAKYRVNISALATKTFYAQMWIILSDVVIGDYFNLHAGFDRNSFAKITKGGVLI